MRTKGSVYNMHADFQGEILEKKVSAYYTRVNRFVNIYAIFYT